MSNQPRNRGYWAEFKNVQHLSVGRYSCLYNNKRSLQLPSYCRRVLPYCRLATAVYHLEPYLFSVNPIFIALSDSVRKKHRYVIPFTKICQLSENRIKEFFGVLECEAYFFCLPADNNFIFKFIQDFIIESRDLFFDKYR